MNKIQVGAAPSPNLKAVRSKIGSLANTTHRPGGGHVKIESHKVDFSKAQPRIEAKNDTYAPGGGDKKVRKTGLRKRKYQSRNYPALLAAYIWSITPSNSL